MTRPTYRMARRSEAKPLVGLYSRSGCGKTLSALYLARGFVGPSGKIAMIETESGRGEMYADLPALMPGSYGVIPMRPWSSKDDQGNDIQGGFSPREYGQAISDAEAEKVDALIIDSASHEWEGVGGVLHMAALNQEAGKKGNQVWQVPKIDHQRHFVGRLLQTSIPLVIVCMRARYPMEQVTAGTIERWKAAGGTGQAPKLGEWVRSPTLEPKQSEDILFEMLTHGWIDEEHRFWATRYARPEMQAFMPSGQPLTIQTGEALGRWAAGTSASSSPPATATEKRPTLAAFKLALEASKNRDDLVAAWKMIGGLPEAEREAATKAFEARRDALGIKTKAKTG